MSLQQIAVLLYIGPAMSALLLAPRYGHSLSLEGVSVILASIAATLAGYSVAIVSNHNKHSHASSSRPALLSVGGLRTLAYLMLLLGLVAIAAAFYKVQSLPLLNKSLGRLEMSTTPLWNIYIFCGVGLFLYAATVERTGKWGICGLFFCTLYIAAALLSAWKGTVLFMTVLLLVPLLKCKRIPLHKLAAAGLAVTALFFFVNWMRAANNSFSDLINQPVYYLIWGFVNFDIEAVGQSSNCLHTIPGFGCRFEVPNHTLILPAFNTYSALAPIYIDGGVLLVWAGFSSMGWLLGISTRWPQSLLATYVSFLCVYFFFMAHNGYMFYSKTYLAALALFCCIDMLLTIASQRKRSTVSAQITSNLTT